MSDRAFKIMAIISDIHIGRQTVSAKSIKMQLKEQFLDVIKKFIYLDGIFITGDIMHTIVSLNSEYAEVFHWFIDKVYHIAKKKGSTVIIVKGTPSHDCDQLNNIRHYEANDDGVDFRIYDTVEQITIWNDWRLLILPDVKVRQLKDVDELLDPENPYDLILGHGTIDSMQYFIQESENMSTKTYFYDVDKLTGCCNGPVFFGHIHQYQNIRNRFYYVGSFTTLERGTDNPGFLVCGISEKHRDKYRVERHLNTMSASYCEIKLSREMLLDYPIDEIYEAIDTIIEPCKPNDLITLKLSLGDERDAIDKVAMLESRYRKDKRISIIKKVKSKREEEAEQRNDQIRAKFSYLMDPNLDMTDIVMRYYREMVMPTLSEEMQKKANLTEERLRNLLDPVVKLDSNRPSNS